MFKTLAATAAALITFATPEAFARNTIGTWDYCGFAAKDAEVTYMKCRQVNLRHDVFRLDWADGKSDIFVQLTNGTIQDSRGGLWLTRAGAKTSGVYRTARSVNSGMSITWRVFAAQGY